MPITAEKAEFFLCLHWCGDRRKWLVFPAMIGGAALLADGMITPPISVTSAVEGLKQVPVLIHHYPDHNYLYCYWYSHCPFFYSAIWNCFYREIFWACDGLLVCYACCSWALFILRMILQILKAFNPYYGIKLLIEYPNGFYILGGVFLMYHGRRSFVFRSGSLRKMEYPVLLDICKNLPDH